ncbi:MAG TPA: hypothetical protein VJC39_03595 [Candidatus Nanoarchaeia archaeon]|nr:hypothetical protein [Candidatus Nanoarchaeia archaeon]
MEQNNSGGSTSSDSSSPLPQTSPRGDRFKSAGSKIVQRTKTYGGKIAQGTGVAAKTGANLTKEVIIGGGAALASGAVASFRARGSLLFFTSLITFILSKTIGTEAWYVYASCFFMIYTASAVFRGGFLITFLFTAWYFILGAASIKSILIYIIPILIAGALIRGFFESFSKRESFGAGSVDELKYGLISILIFLLDSGLVQWAAQEGVAVPEIIIQILAWIPLWTYVGLFFMISDQEGTWLNKIAGAAGIAYLVLVILFLAPSSTGGEDQGLIPSPEELAGAREGLQDAVTSCENQRPKFAWSCFFGDLFSAHKTGDCVEDKVEQCKLDYQCVKIEKNRKGTAAYKRCIQDEIERQKNSILVSGIKDPTMTKKMTVEFNQVDREMQFPSGNKIRHSVNLELENPRLEEINLVLGCKFYPLSNTKNVLIGEVVPKDIKITSEENERTVTCTLPEGQELKPGKHKVEYEVIMSELITWSRLQRAFIDGNLPEEEKQRLREDIKQLHFSGSKYLSQAPEDLVQIQWGMGITLDNPIIESDKELVLSSNILNKGGGEIITIDSYLIDLPPGFIADDPLCLQGFNVVLPTGKTASKKPIYLPLCYLQSIPPDLATPALDYAYREFRAFAKYGYKLKEDFSFTVLDYPTS